MTISPSISAKCVTCGSDISAPVPQMNLAIGMFCAQWCANCMIDPKGDHGHDGTAFAVGDGRQSGTSPIPKAQDFNAYMAQLRAILELRGAPCAVKLSDTFGACLDWDGSVYGFYLDHSGLFDFDASAWAVDCWDAETPVQTWDALHKPQYIAPPR